MTSPDTVASCHQQEVRAGERFEFGKNWTLFLAHLNDDRIATAEKSLQKMLEVENLHGKSFIDIGSGSGLFSLAAYRLGARVHSLDYDPHSVACTAELKRRYATESDRWTVEAGSALDTQYFGRLGQFDVVYSWGVLHHTGQMWPALDNAQKLVAPAGKLFVAIYNDQGSSSVRWQKIKRTYCKLPAPLRWPFAAAVILPTELKRGMGALLAGRFGAFVRSWTQIEPSRGMNHWRDVIDWVGGYPYEYASPEAIFDFYRTRGFTLTKLHCGGVGLGCNEFVFAKA